MKKKIFSLIFAICLIVPVMFLFTACGPETSKSKEITDLRIRLGENEWANSISVDYGKTIGEMFKDVTFYFVYSDGEEKDVVESNFSESEWNEISNSYAEPQYFVQIVNEVTGESNYQPYTGNTTSGAVLEVGQYRVDISLKNKTASIYVSVCQASLQSKQLSVVILPNENNNYGSKLNAVQTYKYGMPINHFEYDEENYTSDYKVYVIDKQNNNKVLSGTDVKHVCALSEVYEGGVSSSFSFDGIEEGDNLLEYYNTIEVLDDSSNIDERATFEKKQAFLSAYGRDITTGYNYSDNSLILQTERLKPGKYHLFAYYESKNYQPIYTEPLTELVVEKGVFNLKKAIRYSGQEWSEENAEEIISKVKININYTFYLGSPLNTVDSQGNVVKALTATQLNQYIDFDYNSDNAFSDVDFGYVGGGYTGLSFLGKFRLVEKDANRKDIRFDSDSVLDESVKFVYILDNNDYYENDPTVYTTDDFDEVSLNISRGQVSRPYASIGNNLSREYTGESQTVENAGLNIGDDDKALLEQIGTYSATEIGNYSITFKLKDSTNFCFREEDDSYNYFGEDDGNGGRTFSWSVTPISFEGYGYDHLEGSYNEEQLEYVSSVQYISGVHTVRVSLPKDSKYDLLKSKVSTAHIVWERVITDNDATATLTQDGDDLIITFESEGYVNLKATIAETDYSLPFENKNFQVVINNADFTQEQKEAILAEIGAEEKDNNEYRLDESHKIRISRISMLLPNVLPDYTDTLNPPATAELGEWKIYRYNGNEYVEKHNGSHLDGEDTIGWSFRFIPSDDMFNGLWVYVDFINDIEFYNEDIPTQAIEALKQTVPFTVDTITNKYIATDSITMIRTSNSIMLPDNTLVVTSENDGYLEYEGIEGKWGVYADDIPFENRSNYYFDVGEQSEEWITSSERVWTIQFVPRNAGYNKVVINVNVIIPNN